MDRRILKTRAAIMQAYLDLMMNSKNKKITISQIARTANIDRKTFYLHYDSVEDIIKELTQTKVDELIHDIKKQALSGKAFTMVNFFEILNHMVEDNLSFFKFISKNQEYDYFFDKMKELLVQEIVNNYPDFFGYSETELTLYTEFYISGIISVYVRWLREQIPISIDDLARLVNRASCEGLQSLLPPNVNVILGAPTKNLYDA
ncbi:MAG: TetR/AcrR family transcriptional regulator [Lachnospiraceae bacterium]